MTMKMTTILFIDPQVSITSQKKKAALPDNPQRFDSCVCVLGKQSFTSGRCYWEVQVRAQKHTETHQTGSSIV